MPRVGDVSSYDKVVLRTCKCWRCRHRGEYEWHTSLGGQRVPNSKKMLCTKTNRWGSLTRAYWCKHFESNSSDVTEEMYAVQK